MSKYVAHPLANIFPRLDGPQLDALTADVKENGLVYPIVLYEGKILDGRNRYSACLKAHVLPRFETYRGKTPLKHIISLNLKRRHLDESQRAMCAARSVDWRVGRRPAGEKSPIGDVLLTREEAATQFNVGARTIERAHALLAASEGDAPTVTPTLVAAVDAGKIAVSAAAVLAERPRREQERLVHKVESGAIKASGLITEIKRAETRAELGDVAARKAKAAKGVYDVLVIDPPWPMEKIEREVRPNQTAFDYPTMTEDQLMDVKEWYGRETLPYADNAHVWLWTTHKFLPMALRLLETWGLKYVCAFVWHKPGGPQPYGLPQYNCEFALYARYGAPEFVDTKGLPTCFTAPRGKHSEKPAEFYETLRRVTDGRRLDIFNRRAIEGFDGWGKESPRDARATA